MATDTVYSKSGVDTLVGTLLTSAGAKGVYETVVQHGSTAATTRPAGAVSVLWLGTVAPTNGTPADDWRDLSAAPYVTRTYNGTAWVAQPVAAPLTTAATATTNAALAVNVVTPVDATAAARTMTLPSTGLVVGSEIAVEKADSTANTVTVSGTIRGTAASSIVLSLYRESVVFVAESATSWRPVAGHKTLSSLDGRYLRIAKTYASTAAAQAGLTAGEFVDGDYIVITG